MANYLILQNVTGSLIFKNISKKLLLSRCPILHQKDTIPTTVMMNLQQVVPTLPTKPLENICWEIQTQIWIAKNLASVKNSRHQNSNWNCGLQEWVTQVVSTSTWPQQKSQSKVLFSEIKRFLSTFLGTWDKKGLRSITFNFCQAFSKISFYHRASLILK